MRRDLFHGQGEGRLVRLGRLGEALILRTNWRELRGSPSRSPAARSEQRSDVSAHGAPRLNCHIRHDLTVALSLKSPDRHHCVL